MCRIPTFTGAAMQRARATLILAISLILGACAGDPSRHYAYDPDKDDFDASKYESVQEWAHTHGATVIWVNYPTKYRPREIANQPSSQPPK